MRMFCGALPAHLLQMGTDTEEYLESYAVPALASLIDLFPSMRSIPEWCPGGAYKKGAREYLELKTKMWSAFRDEVKRQAVLPNAQECIWGNLYRSNAFERYGFTDDEATHIIGNSLGSDFLVSDTG